MMSSIARRRHPRLLSPAFSPSTSQHRRYGFARNVTRTTTPLISSSMLDPFVAAGVSAVSSLPNAQ